MRDLLRAAEQYHMLPEDAKVLAAVSGGADSMCLLGLLAELWTRGVLKLEAAHFDHCLRGEESLRDAAFVRDYCAARGIPFHLGRGDVAALAKSRGLGIEEAARMARYAFLEKTAEEIGADRIATAHTADDNAETMLFNLARGAGLRGAAGIPPVRGKMIRPLLFTERERIMEYLTAEKIPHVEDSSNGEDVYTRNRLRHGAVPVLKRINPRFAENMSETAALLREDEAFITDIAREFLDKAEKNAFEITVDAAAFDALPGPVAARVVREAAQSLGAPASRALASAVREISASSSGSRTRSFGGGLTLLREYGEMKFTTLSISAESFEPAVLEPENAVYIPELGMQFTYLPEPGPEKIYNQFNTFLFKKVKVYGKITVRPKMAGDRIALSGRNGTKTLKKLFIDEKLPKRLRNTIPVIADESGVIAVLGFGTDKGRIPLDGEEAAAVVAEKIGEV